MVFFFFSHKDCFAWLVVGFFLFVHFLFFGWFGFVHFVVAPSLEMFKTRLDVALGNLI